MFKRLKALLTRAPRLQVQHPDLGMLTLHEGYWRGEWQHEDRPIGLVLAGTEAGPAPALIERLRALLNKSSPVRQSAVEFICAQKRLFNASDFALRSVRFPDANRPEIFVMEFSVKGDEEGLWRVEFERNQATRLARDKA